MGNERTLDYSKNAIRPITTHHSTKQTGSTLRNMIILLYHNLA